MGHEIVYCFGCQTRLLSSDFEQGKAVRFEDRVACATCAKSFLESLPPEQRPKPVKRKPESHLAAVTPRRATRLAPAMAPPPPVEKGRPWGLLLGGGGAALVGIGILIAVMSGGSADPPPIPPAPPPAAEKPPAPNAEPERHAEARLALAKADGMNSAPLDDRIRAYDDAVRAAAGTPFSGKAIEAFNALVVQRQKMHDEDLAKLEDEARPLLAKEAFKEARAVMEAARKRHDLAEWEARVDRTLREIEATVARLFEGIEREARDARMRGDKEKERTARDRVAKWGIDQWVRNLDASLAAVKPPMTASPELVAYRKAWKGTAGRAAGGEVDAAIVALRREGEKVKDPEERKEIDEDLRDWARLKALQAEARKLAAAYAPGEKASFEVFDEKGARIRREGLVAAIGDHRGKLLDAEEKDIVVEFDDLSARGLGEIYLAKKEGASAADRRVLALGCLFQGDLAGADAVGRGEGIPSRYIELAKVAKAPSVPAREAEARALFYAAEREFKKVETRAEAVGRYSRLKAEYADTRVAAREAERISERADTGKEYVFTAHEISGGGIFRREEDDGGRLRWMAATMGEPSLENYVEFEFSAMPGRVYRCWVYAGACCAETFALDYQATGMTGPHPERRTRKVPIDPGTEFAAEVKHGIRYLKRTHETHGGPKWPARWHWIPIKLQAEPAPGTRKVRLVTHQKGFAVLAALVSSVREHPPKEKETPGFLAKAVENKVVPEIVTEGLVGHWKLDDGSGEVAADSVSPAQPGQIRGNPEWTEGVHGGALRFDGVDDHVELPRTPALKDLHKKSFTLAAWFKPDDTPPGAGDANDANYGILILSGQHSGLVYAGGKKFLMDLWIKDGHPATGTWDSVYEPGKFYHIAGRVDYEAGTNEIWVNGKKVRGNSFTGGSEAKDYASPWRIGVGHPTQSTWGWHAKGVIDDVRMYNRALGAEELQELYAAGLDR